MNDIPLDLYRVFYYVTKEGGFSRAARRLHISQSAVSQAVKRLEGQLGRRLLSRNSRHIALTEEGKHLLPVIRAAVIALEDLGEQYEGAEQHGTVRLGAGDTVFRYYLVEPLKRFHQKYPAIRFQVTNRTSEQLMRRMRDGALDLTVVSRPIDAAPHPNMHPFAEMTYVFAASAGLAGRFGKSPDPVRLADIPLLLPERDTTARRNLDRYFGGLGITLKPEIELESFDLLIDLARAGLGAAYVPIQSTAPFREELHLLPGIHLTQPLMLYLPEDALIPACARLFIRELQAGAV
jgi:DNA-binding transcriptional LysR family regulator